MPIYEYQCGLCGTHLEKLQKISDQVLRNCPQCGKASLEKMISATSFRLKGTGWYETDFKTGKKKHGIEDKSGKSDKASEQSATEKQSAGSNSKGSSKDSTAKAGESVKSSAKKEASP